MQRVRTQSSGYSKRPKTAVRSVFKPQRSRFRSSYGRFPLKPTGFPPKLSIAQRYVSTHNLVASGATPTIYSFRANGMYDPDHTSTGHYPMYFNTCKAIYDHYTVWESVLKLTVSAASSAPVLVGVFLNDDSTVVPGNASALCEQSTAVYGVATISEPLVLHLKFNAKKIFGGSVLANDNLQGTGLANPSEETFFSIFSLTAGEEGSSTAVVVAEIIYKAIWDELKDQPLMS